MNTNTYKEGSDGQEKSSKAEAEAEKENSQEASSEPEDQLVVLQEKLQESEKKYLYLYAEFENFRRRTERDRLDFLKFGHEGYLREVLQVVDNFERAISHAKTLGGENGGGLKQVCQGIEMIHFQMMEVLRNQGVAGLTAVGAKFDPNLHEAVGEEEAEAEAGTVLKEMQKGYTLHGKLLRPARVIVAKKKN